MMHGTLLIPKSNAAHRRTILGHIAVRLMLYPLYQYERLSRGRAAMMQMQRMRSGSW